MNVEQKVLLDEFLERVARLSVSIVLAGSHAYGGAQESSDVDLIVVTRHRNEAETVQGIVDQLNKSGLRPVLDCKVYTEREFASSKSITDNRFIWTCLTHGRVLSGRDIIGTVKLNPRAVVDSVWRCVQNVQQTCDKLESSVQFTGCCYHMYDALATIYFVDRFILRSVENSVTKRDFIQHHLGDQYSQAQERYYWVARHAGAMLPSQTLRISASADRRFKPVDYSRMRQQCRGIVELLEKEFRQVKNWADSLPENGI